MFIHPAINVFIFIAIEQGVIKINDCVTLEKASRAKILNEGKIVRKLSPENCRTKRINLPYLKSSSISLANLLWDKNRVLN